MKCFVVTLLRLKQIQALFWVDLPDISIFLNSMCKDIFTVHTYLEVTPETVCMQTNRSQLLETLEIYSSQKVILEPARVFAGAGRCWVYTMSHIRMQNAQHFNG